MTKLADGADVRPELLRDWGSGVVPVPEGFWSVAQPRELSRIGEAARASGQLEVIDKVAQCAFAGTLNSPDSGEQRAFADVFAAVELGHPGNAGLQS